MKENDNGRHRRAQADHPNPGASQGAGSTTRSYQAAGQATRSGLGAVAHFAGQWGMTFTEVVDLAVQDPRFAVKKDIYIQNGIELPLTPNRPWQGTSAQVLFDDEIQRLINGGHSYQNAYDQTVKWWQSYTSPRPAPSRLFQRHGATAFPDASAEQPEPVDEDMPILAHRAAHLRLQHRKGVYLQALNQGVPLEVDMEAVCNLGHGHQAPHWDCRCGFYAVPSDIDSWHEAMTVDLLVELSGIVIEYTRGYRAQHQHICEVILPLCDICGKESVNALVTTDLDIGHFVCERHTRGDALALGCNELAEQLGIPVSGRQIHAEK